MPEWSTADRSGIYCRHLFSHIPDIGTEVQTSNKYIIIVLVKMQIVEQPQISGIRLRESWISHGILSAKNSRPSISAWSRTWRWKKCFPHDLSISGRISFPISFSWPFKQKPLDFWVPIVSIGYTSGWLWVHFLFLFSFVLCLFVYLRSKTTIYGNYCKNIVCVTMGVFNKIYCKVPCVSASRV